MSGVNDASTKSLPGFLRRSLRNPYDDETVSVSSSMEEASDALQAGGGRMTPLAATEEEESGEEVGTAQAPEKRGRFGIPFLGGGGGSFGGGMDGSSTPDGTGGSSGFRFLGRKPKGVSFGTTSSQQIADVDNNDAATAAAASSAPNSASAALEETSVTEDEEDEEDDAVQLAISEPVRTYKEIMFET